MGAALIVSFSSVTVLVITAGLALRRHKRVRRERHEAPGDRYRREVTNIRETIYLRSAPRGGWRRRRNSDVGSAWAAGMTSHCAARSPGPLGQTAAVATTVDVGRTA